MRSTHCSCWTKKIYSILVLAVLGTPAQAAFMETFITGETGGADVVFRALFDPAVAGSAAITVAATESDTGLRLDGIEFLAGSKDIVVVGAQRPGAPDDGALTSYNVRTGAELPDIWASTNTGIFAPTASKPSTVFPTAAGTYYIENQFGLTGAPEHRIMFLPSGGATPVVVFGGAVCSGPLGSACVNFEGLEISGTTMYTFIEDPADPTMRALLSIPLSAPGDAGGVWDGSPPTIEMSGLHASGPGGDGSDELDFDMSTGILYGTNIDNGEIIFFDPGLGGGFLIPGSAILGSFGNLSLLDRSGGLGVDGIRTTNDGAYLILAHQDGLLLSIDLAGILGGLGDEDVTLLYDASARETDFTFDDLTSLAAVPVAPVWALLLLGAPILARRKLPIGSRDSRGSCPITAGQTSCLAVGPS